MSDRHTLSMNDRGELMTEATKWLLEMQLLNNPHMKNSLILNIYKVSNYIKDVEILIDENNKRMLVYIALGGYGRLFKKREISQDVLDMLQEVLPSFQLRVTLDPELFSKSVKGLQAYLEKRAAIVKAKAEAEAEAKKAGEAEQVGRLDATLVTVATSGDGSQGGE